MIKFDHIEVHVSNSKKYALFLKKLFKAGRFKKISENETFMFISADDIHIEIKQSSDFIKNELKTYKGFCLPCLRMKGAFEHLKNINELTITSKIKNPDGFCYFFKDYEGIDWHMKDYDIQDIYVNI